MNKTVDVYLPLDERPGPNKVVWPIAQQQLKHLCKVIRKCGWTPHVLNPDKPVQSVAEGIRVIRSARGARFINFIAAWAYPDFSVSPMSLLPADVPKLFVGSILPDFPGAVGLLAAASGTEHVGIRTSRVFVEKFENYAEYEDAVATFLKTGKYQPSLPEPIKVTPTSAQRKRAVEVANKLRGMIYGVVGPRSMQMWNKISEADFLTVFGVVREGFDALRLAKMAEKISDARAEKAIKFLVDKGMQLKLGPDPKLHLTRDMVKFQMKTYFALLELKKRYGIDFLGVQDQLDWIEYYPATDLVLGLLNNKLRPETDGTTVVTATEADDGAAITMQIFKLLTGGEPVAFNDLRYWNGKGLYWFVNSGALAPYYAYKRHDSLEGSWSERQQYMYFKNGGGTCSVVVRVPGVMTWARTSYRNGKLYICAGRGVTDVPTDEQWKARSARCSPEWPHWYVRLCGPVEWKINTNHPMAVFGDYLGELKALADVLGISFECYDNLTPSELS
jgi:L-fucose isomerase-like protein